METIADIFAYLGEHLDSFAGLAALVNGLILWPIVRSQKEHHKRTEERLDEHDSRITKLETA